VGESFVTAGLAGTVLTVGEVRAVADAGGTLIVSPNRDDDVIRSPPLGLVQCGYVT